MVADEVGLDAFEDRTQYVCLADIFQWVRMARNVASQLEEALERIAELEQMIGGDAG